MGFYIPQPIWNGEDVFIIGGGPSLKNFDWNLLEGLNTIGCNDAYLLGSDVCKVCLFSDLKWFMNHRQDLEKYDGLVYGPSSDTHSLPNKPMWLNVIKRYAKGIQGDGIGWNGNTGVAAINLAILLGATRVFLLGFDMKRTREDSNWHLNNIDKNPPEVYQKFIEWFKYFYEDWKSKYSHIEIINVTDSSELPYVQKIPVEVFWAERKQHERAAS
jgi:hypothetical protein